MTVQDANFPILTFPTFDEASKQASLEGQAIMCATVPGVLYRQANRYMIATSLPMGVLVNSVKLDSVAKGADPTSKRNRPLMPDHVRVISTYLKENDDYILPPITLNVGSDIRCFTTEANAPTRSVSILMPPGFKCYVTDGQHRIEAIREALDHKPDLQLHAVAVNLVFEDDIDQIHQDFADCAQSKPIPNSLLAAFNSRSPLFSLLKRVTEEVPFFRGRIDRTSKSIGKTSLNLFTLNQIRFSVAELLLGNSIVSADELNKSAGERLSSTHKDFYEDGIVWFYNTLAKYNPHWKSVSEATGVTVPIDIPDHRTNFVDFTATGLQVISRVGYAIMWTKRGGVDDREELIRKLAEIDYRRTAKLWQGNIIEDENLKTNRGPVNNAVSAVKKAIGLESGPEEDKSDA
jgi:DNA sulfur modification protein DndB